MDGEKPSTSRGFQGDQENNANTMRTNEPGCSNGMCGECVEEQPEQGIIDEINKLVEFFQIELNELASKKSLFKESVTQWLGERWSKVVPDLKPCEEPTLPTIDNRPKPVYCWWERREQTNKSPTAPASSSYGTASTSSTSRDDAVFAELKQSGAYEYFNQFPHLKIETEPPNYQKITKKQEQDQEGVNTASSSDSGQRRRILPKTPSSSKDTLLESPIIEIPASLLLKCQPRPQGMPGTSEESTPTEDDLTHIILSIDLNDVMSIEGRKSRSLERQPRPECKTRRSASSDSSWKSCDENKRPCFGLKAKIKKIFKSEDNLLHKVACRSHVLYCTYLYYWYRACKSYKKFGEGMRQMNRENR